MGASFTNVQVHAANRDPAEVRAVVVEALRQWMVENSYDVLEDDGGESDRAILVAPVGQEPRIGVYDEFTESQDANDVQALARMLSAAVNGVVMAVLVYDSDVLQLWLFRSGQLTDTYVSNPDLLDEALPDKHEHVSGRPEQWRDLLAADASLDDLAKAFASKDVLAEDTLLGITPLLDLSSDRVQDGYNFLTGESYMMTGQGPTLQRHDLSSFANLRFRRTSGPALRRVAGLPNLHPGGGGIEETLSVGERLGVGERHVLGASASNVGGPLKGLRIVFWGTALDDGLIQPEGVSVITRRAGETGIERLEVQLERGGSEGVSFVHAIPPDYDLAAGIERSGDMLTSLTARGTSLRRLMAAEGTAQVTAMIRSLAVKPGDGQLHVGFAPLENQTDGQTSWSFEVHVVPKADSADG